MTNLCTNFWRPTFLNRNTKPMQTIIREEDVMLLQKQLSRQMPTVAIKERIKTLKHLRSVILSHLDEIEQALFEDLHKSREESYMTETGIVLSEISYQLKHLKHWSRKKRVRSSLSSFRPRHTECLRLTEWC